MRRFVPVLTLAVLLLTSTLTAQQIYKWQDEKGQWHFSDRAPADLSGVERREVSAPIPEELPENEPCAPFKPEETRSFKAHKPSPDFPHIQMVDFQVRMTDVTKITATFSWKMIIKNTSTEREGIRGSVRLMDCDGFLLAEDTMEPTAILPGEEVTLTGKTPVFAPVFQKISRFSSGFSGSRPVRAPTRKAEIKDTFRKPDVRVYYTELQQTSSGVYFTGEVYNVGLAPARHVKVTFTIVDQRGVKVVENKVESSPSELKPGQKGIFRERVPYLTDNRGYGWHSKAEWSE